MTDIIPGFDDQVEPRVAEALLRVVPRPEDIDPVAMERALDAFRSARLDAAPPRTRRCDDWRPDPRRRLKRARRAAALALACSLALGGVAYALVTLPHHTGHPTPRHTSPTPSAGLDGHPSPHRTPHPPPSPGADGGAQQPGKGKHGKKKGSEHGNANGQDNGAGRGKGENRSEEKANNGVSGRNPGRPPAERGRGQEQAGKAGSGKQDNRGEQGEQNGRGDKEPR